MSSQPTTDNSQSEMLRERVRDRYTAAARQASTGTQATDSGCGQSADCGCGDATTTVGPPSVPGSTPPASAASCRRPRCWQALAADGLHSAIIKAHKPAAVAAAPAGRTELPLADNRACC